MLCGFVLPSGAKLLTLFFQVPGNSVEHILEHGIDGGWTYLLSLLQCAFNLVFDLFLQTGILGFTPSPIVDEMGFEARNRIFLDPFLNFLLIPVNSRIVGCGVSSLAVSHRLNESRSFSPASPVSGFTGDLLSRNPLASKKQTPICQDNLDAVADSPYHFIGSLVPTQHPELLEVPLARFRSLADEGLAAVSVYRSSKRVFGVERTILVTYNENLFVAQSRTLLREISKRQQKLRELQQRLVRWRSGKIRSGRPPTPKGIQKKVKGWLKARHMKELFSVQITEQEGYPMIHYRFEDRAWRRLQKTLLGKTLLFTDLEHWRDAEIVRGYRSLHHIETSFRLMKDPHHISLRPQYHWTDQKIQVHVFCCVLALMLVSLLQRELHQRGIDGSIPGLLRELGKIREVAVVYPPKEKRRQPTLQMTVSEMSDRQQALFDTLELHRFLAA